jgi:hypothetical protein
MAIPHSRVAPGSLVLLEPSDSLTGINSTYLASGPAQAMARLKSGKTTVVAVQALYATPIATYAVANGRPVVVASSTHGETYAAQIAVPTRVVDRSALVILDIDLSNITDPIVVLGDLHQCWRTYLAMRDDARRKHGENVLLVIAGDVSDKGGNGPEDVVTTFSILMSDWAAGDLLVVAGNHDVVLATRLAKALHAQVVGTEPTSQHRTPRALLHAGGELATAALRWLQDLPLYLRIGSTVVVHAAWDPELAEKYSNSKRFMEHCLYGPRPPRGQPRYDARGKYVSVDWAPHYTGADTVIHGHHDYPEVSVIGKVIGLDTGCVTGNRLTGFLVGSDPADKASFISRATVPGDIRTSPVALVLEPDGDVDPVE